MAAKEKRGKEGAEEPVEAPKPSPARKRGRPVKKAPSSEEPATRNSKRLDGDALKRKRPVVVALKKKALLAKRALRMAKRPAPKKANPTQLRPAHAEVKKEPPEEPKAESPLVAFDSRSSSPRSGRKRRTSSDLLMMMNSDDPPSDAAASSQSAQKTLRSGKRRSLKDALLDEEAKKRRRLASEEPKDEPEPIDAPVVEPDPPRPPPPPPEDASPEKVEELADDSTEKLAEKSLILDNMSKTFNDAALTEGKPKSIRRSARQRKSTVKAKEREEAPPPEKDVAPEERDSFESDASKTPEPLKDAPDGPQIEEVVAETKPDDANDSQYSKSYTDQDFDKIIDRLKCFEEQDRKRQEEQSKLNGRPAAPIDDVAPIPEPLADARPPKDPTLSRETEMALDSLEANTAISIVKREDARKSFDIDLPSGVTLIKKCVGASARRPIASPSKSDAVTVFDKCLGTEVTLDIRKSIDKGIISIEATSKVPIGTHISVTTKSQQRKEMEPIPVPKESTLEIISLPPIVPIPVEAPVEISTTVTPDLIVETPEKQKEKEEILKTLGLLTLKAASQAKIEKERQKELMKTNKTTVPKYPANEYTGTLKTVIKLNRTSPDKKKGRSPLKMTFQKSKGRNSKYADSLNGDSESDDNPYYTIHKEFGGSSGSGTGSSDNHMTSGGHRKTHYSNRFNNHELGLHDSANDIATEANSTKESGGLLVIPEKASSFAIHPGRLCQDQCYYCRGKFGLFDTPCHIAQIKSSDRQKKILDNEEKLTVDSCLCDACFRHVDRRANCPSYRKRTGPGALPPTTPSTGTGDSCHANSCGRPAPHTLRRKWLVKMRKSISKVVQLDLDYPGLHTIPLCDIHYQAVSQLMVCGLCKRRLLRNHVHYINQEYKTLNALLREQNIPVIFEEKPVVCKSCRYFCTLLLKPPPNNELNKHAFLKSHRRRLKQAYNIAVAEDSDSDLTDEPSATPPESVVNDQADMSKEKKRIKNGKGKSKKVSDGSKLSDENCLTDKNGPNKGLVVPSENVQSSKLILEDMESLISSSKILVPGQNTGVSTINVGDSNIVEYDNPLIAELDKRSEFQNILQKCNVPSSTILQKITDPNQKPRNVLKVHNATASTKGSQNQKRLNRNERRTQKLGQIITHKNHFEETLSTKIPNRDEFTIEPMNAFFDDRCNRDNAGNNILRNIALNDECTIETIPSKPSKNSLDINSLKSKWVMTESFSQVKRNLNALSKNAEQMKKKGINQSEQYSNPVQRLETNPSISVRELFPGEEEMNLHCSIEFGNIKAVTPEGWEKCNTIIQYDNQTKNLWQELQKPYGNQSSFLRHLILLEKYFRNGDLVLSQFANENAITYSESVQNRLRSYDNIPTNGDIALSCSPPSAAPKNTQATITAVCFSDTETSKQSDNNLDFRKPSAGLGSGKSLLKSNQNTNTDSSKTGKLPKTDNTTQSMNTTKNGKNGEQTATGTKQPKNMPVILTQLEKLGNQLTPIQVPVTPRPPTPRPDASKASSEVSKAPSLPTVAASETKTNTAKPEGAPQKSKASSVPPELIAINQTNLPKKNIENVVKNIHLKGSSTPVNPTTPASTTVSPSFSSISPISNAVKNPKPPSSATKDASKKKGKGSNKHWKPTLIPITDESKARSGRNRLHQAADGRRLPSLVQVMLGGKPYFITIEDYNRMCIMRREKLQQEKKYNQKKNQSTTTQDTTPVNPTEISIEATPLSTITTGHEAEKLQTTTSSKNAPDSIISSNNTSKDENDDGKLDADTASLLKNVSLKNVTIAPVTEIKLTPPMNTTQSLLLPATKNVLQMPPIISQLGSSISVSTDTIINNDINALATLTSKVIPITSQTTIMPKIPKSLTVIPQTVNNNPSSVSSALVPVMQSMLPLTVLPLISTSTLTVSQSEP